MRRNTSSEAGDRAEQGGEKSDGLETVEDKAREALKHDQPGKNCDVTVRAHNRDHDAYRSVTEHLFRTGEEWIAVRTWTEDGGGLGLAVRDYGETLQLEAVGLDHDIIADHIRSEAVDAVDSREAVGRPVKPFIALGRNVEAVTKDLVARWRFSAECVVEERLHRGFAGWTGQIAWIECEGEDLYMEAGRAAAEFIDEQVTCDVSDDVKSAIQDIYVQALYDAIAEHHDYRTPRLEFAAEVALID